MEPNWTFFGKDKVELSGHLYIVCSPSHKRSFASHLDGHMIIIVGGWCVEEAHIVFMYSSQSKTTKAILAAWS